MKNLFDIDRFIKVNDLQEVTTQRLEISQNIPLYHRDMEDYCIFAHNLLKH